MLKQLVAFPVSAPLLWRLHPEVLAHADERLSTVPQAHTFPQIAQVCVKDRVEQVWTDVLTLLCCHRPDPNLDQLIAKIYPNLDE